jgi:hypothetical protein
MNKALYKDGEAIRFTNGVEGKYSLTQTGIVESSIENDGMYTYTIKSSGVLIPLVPETDITGVYSLMDKQVDEILRQKESSKEFKDSDIRVKGSKKEMMAYKGLITGKDLTDIEKTDSATARALIKKDRVYPKVNIEEEINKGTSGGALYLKMKLRDSCGSNPPDTAECRSIYVNFIEYVVLRMEQVYDMRSFSLVADDLVNKSLIKLILIANPDLLFEIEKQKLDMEKELNKLSEYRTKKDYYFDEIKKTNNGNIKWDWTYATEEQKELKEKHDYWQNLEKIANDYQYNNLIPIEKEFIERVTKKSKVSGASTASNKIIEEIFGVRFVNILKIYKGDKIWNEAYAFEPVTELEYNVAYNVTIEPKVKQVEKNNTWADYLLDKSRTYTELKDYALNVTDMKNWSNSGGSHYGLRGTATLERLISAGNIDNTVRFINSVANSYRRRADEFQAEVDRYKEYYKVRENDYSFATKEKEKRVIEKRAELTINSGVPLSYIKRIGGVAVFDTDLDTGDKFLSFYKDKLGIEGVTYGISMPDKERSSHAKHFAGAYLDLAELINWDVKHLTSLGNLKMLFGAAGSGRAAAHYSPTHNAINLTRSNGDGTVAHEMMHYIDRNLVLKFPKDNESVKNHAAYGSFTDAQNISDFSIYDAMMQLMKFIKDGAYVKYSGGDYVAEYPYLTIKNKETLKPLLEQYFKEYTQREIEVVVLADEKLGKIKYTGKETIEDAIAYTRSEYPHYFNYFNYQSEPKYRRFFVEILNGYGIKSYTLILNNDVSELRKISYKGSPVGTMYYLNSKKMGSAYWTFDWELLARSFETYISLKQIKHGRENNYLVSGAFFNRPEGVYPVGAEREVIYMLYENLFNVIKEQLNIPDFVPFREERVNEYVLLNEDDTERDAVVVNTDTHKQVTDKQIEEIQEETPESISVAPITEEKPILDDKEKIRLWWVKIYNSIKGEDELFYDGGVVEKNSSLVSELFDFAN